MQAVKSKDSQIELTLRRELWKRGIRYRLHRKDIAGTPDIAFIGKKLVVFVDSEFWHGKDWVQNKIKSNTEFWNQKIERNIARDKSVNEKLRKEGILSPGWAT